MVIDIRWNARNNQWAADVHATEGKRERKYLGKDRPRAKAKLYQFLADYYAERAKKDNSRRCSSSLPLNRFVQMFLDWNKTNKSFETWRTYKDGLQYLIRRYPDTLSDEITPAHIERRVRLN